MPDWISAFLGTDLPEWQRYLLLAAGAVFVLLIVVWLLRKLTRGTFVSGGRQAQPRISVEDAAPVDSHRRLVLVRRDDVEHLLLIGGASDIVVEHNIRPGAPAQMPVQREFAERPRAAAPQPVQPYPAPPAPVQPSMAHAAQPPRPVAPPAMPTPRPVMPVQPPRAAAAVDPAPQRMEPRLDQPAPAAPVVRPEASRFATPTALQRVEPQLPGSLPSDPRPAPAPAAPVRHLEDSLDDELEKMLGEFDVSAPGKPN